MKKFLVVTAIVVSSYIANVSAFAQADNSYEELQRMMEVLYADAALERLSPHIGTALKLAMVSFRDFQELETRIAQLPRQHDAMCSTLPALNYTTTLNSMREAANQTLELIEDAQALIAKGATPSEPLKMLLQSDWGKSMEKIVAISTQLEGFLSGLETFCGKKR